LAFGTHANHPFSKVLVRAKAPLKPAHSKRSATWPAILNLNTRPWIIHNLKVDQAVTLPASEEKSLGSLRFFAAEKTRQAVGVAVIESVSSSQLWHRWR